MAENIDVIDRKILSMLQKDATASVDAISDAVTLSRNACWRRIKQMEASGVITARVALVDPVAAGCPLQAMVMILHQSMQCKFIILPICIAPLAMIGINIVIYWKDLISVHNTQRVV